MMQENEHNSIAFASYLCMPAPQMDILHSSANGKVAHVDCGVLLWKNTLFPQHVDSWHDMPFVDYQ